MWVQEAPRGEHKCTADCNGVGVCQAAFGYCVCPAGGAALSECNIFCDSVPSSSLNAFIIQLCKTGPGNIKTYHCKNHCIDL